MRILTREQFQFIALIGFSIILTYSVPETISSFWYLITLFLYYRSKNEPFWLAYFFVTTDGFMGFLGVYSANLTILPGMPEIEVVQLYILLSVIKASRIKNVYPVFLRKWYSIILLFIVVLIVWGIGLGIDEGLKVYLRIFKLTFPFALFYSLPRLFNDTRSYRRLMEFLFLVVILAFVTTIFSFISGINVDFRKEVDVKEFSNKTIRLLLNPWINIISFGMALVFMSFKSKLEFTNRYLYLVVGMSWIMFILSATRGWIVGFSFVLLIYFTVIQKIRTNAIIGILIITILFLGLIFFNDSVANQFQFAIDRLISLEDLAEGDVTAGGTLQRLDVRGPRVLAVWEDQKILGYGFSSTYFNNSDHHVAFHNILLHSGVIGLALFIIFFISFYLSVYLKALNSTKEYKRILLTLLAFITGWLLLHSTSRQDFGFYGMPRTIIPQAIFFSFTTLIYYKASLKH